MTSLPESLVAIEALPPGSVPKGIDPRQLAKRGDHIARRYWYAGIAAYATLALVVVSTLSSTRDQGTWIDAVYDLVGLGGTNQNVSVFALVVGGIVLTALSGWRVLSDIRNITKEEVDVEWVKDYKQRGLPLVFDDEVDRRRKILTRVLHFEISADARVETLIDERVRRVHIARSTNDQGMVGTAELRSIAEVRTAEYGSFARHAVSMLLLVAVLGTFAGIKTALPQLIVAINGATGGASAAESSQGLVSALSAVAAAFGGNSLALIGAVAVGLMAQGVSLGRRNLLERLELVSMEYIYGQSVGAEGNPLQGAIVELKEAVREMRNQSNAMNGVGDDLRTLSTSFTESFDKLETRLQGIADQQEARLHDRTADSLDDLRRRLGEMARISETNAQVYAGLAEAVRTRSKETDNALGEMRGTNQQLANALTGILEATRLSTDSFNSIRVAVDELKRGSGGVQEQTIHLVGAVGQVETIVLGLAKSIDAADVRLKAFESQTMNGWRQIGEQVATRMHDAVEPLRSVAADIKAFDGKAADTLKRLGSASAVPQFSREDRADLSAPILNDIRQTLEDGRRLLQRAMKVGLIVLSVAAGVGLLYVLITLFRS